MDTEEKLRLINARQGRRLHKLVHGSLPALAESAAPLDRKVIQLRAIADKVGELMAPFTPCSKGCSACCHKPALISEMDAMLVGEATGRAVATPTRGPCDHPTRKAAAVDLTAVYVGELRMAGPMMIWSDIREFFPAG